MPAPICLIVNPSAGGGRAARIAPEVESALRARGLSVRTVHTRDLDHARELAVEAAEAGETVAALSGDGLVGVMADTLIGTGFPFRKGDDLGSYLRMMEAVMKVCAGMRRPGAAAAPSPRCGARRRAPLPRGRRRARARDSTTRRPRT